MEKQRQQRVVDALLRRWKQSYCAEAGIKLTGKPAPLYQLLVAATLFSARIGAGQALRATSALLEQGLTTPAKMCDAGWEKRVEILNRNGYARYDESTSRMLGDAAELLLDRYDGDLRRLREEADRDREKEARLLQQFKGIGAVGAAIYLREVQVIWPEVFPFLDRRGREGAIALGLPRTARTLAGLTRGPARMAQLASCLVRIQLLSGPERREFLAGV